jgi:ABC-type spermidine/putrescine transport system permease subunit I
MLVDHGAGDLYTLRRLVSPLVASRMMLTSLFIFILNGGKSMLALSLT